MNSQTERHNTDLHDRSKYMPMVICPEEEATETIEDRFVRPARDNENANFYVLIEKLKDLS